MKRLLLTGAITLLSLTSGFALNYGDNTGNNRLFYGDVYELEVGSEVRASPDSPAIKTEANQKVARSQK
jgi:hypothetical protein